MESARKISKSTLALTLGLAGLLSAADNWIAAPLLPSIASGFGLSVSMAGLALVCYLIPYGVMQPVYGQLSDRYGKAKMLRIIVFGLAAGSAGCALAPDFISFCVLRAITGFFAAGIIAVSLALLGDTLEEKERQGGVGLFMGYVFLGQGLSVGLGGILAQSITWRSAFMLIGLAAFASALSLRKLPSGSGKSCANGKNIFEASASALKTPQGRVIFPFALATGFLLIGAYSFIGAYLSFKGLNPLQSGFILMSFGFAGLFAGRLSGKVAKLFGRRKTLLVGAALSLASSLLLAASGFWALALLSSLLLGGGYIFLQSTLATAAFEVASEAKGLPSALIGLGLFGGGGLGSAFAGWLLSFGSYAALWLVFAALDAAFLALIASKRGCC